MRGIYFVCLAIKTKLELIKMFDSAVLELYFTHAHTHTYVRQLTPETNPSAETWRPEKET